MQIVYPLSMKKKKKKSKKFFLSGTFVFNVTDTSILDKDNSETTKVLRYGKTA